MFQLIHKSTGIKPPSATLVDNIYTNINITIDSCKSGILTSNMSDHFFVFGIFDDKRINQTKIRLKQDILQLKNISKFAKTLSNKTWENLYQYNNAQDSFTLF